VSFLPSSVASCKGWPILPGPALRCGVCSRRDSVSLAMQAMSCKSCPVVWCARVLVVVV
jgi:hypothetical protein